MSQKNPEKGQGLPRAICPNCESLDTIVIDSMPSRLKCRKCGYVAERDLFWTRSDE